MDVDSTRVMQASRAVALPAQTAAKADLTAVQKKHLPKGYSRVTKLHAPIMQLTGHESDIFCAQISNSGRMLASAGMDRQVFFWLVYGECANYHVIRAHKGAILQLHFASDDSHIYTASTDFTVGVIDVETGVRLKRMKGHKDYVSSVHSARRGPPLVVSGSDDHTVHLWDIRQRLPVSVFDATYQVTAVTFNDTSDRIICGGIDNNLKVFDVRKVGVPIDIWRGHGDTITGMELSPDGHWLLTNAMDNTLRVWDVRPYVLGARNVQTMGGHNHTFEKNLLRCAWSPDGAFAVAGSGDRFVYVWDTKARFSAPPGASAPAQLIYKLPGHLGSVNDVDFHPHEPILMSASSDKTIYLGELTQT